MKKTIKLLAMALTGAMLTGVLASCAPAPTAPVPAPAPAQTTPAPAPAAAAPAAPEAPQAAQNVPSGSLIIAVIAESPSITPARHNHVLGVPLNFMTHNRLFQQHHETFESLPYLVREWRALSDVLFEFTLHEGITFHNGDEMTTDDIVASWYWVRQTPDTQGAHRGIRAIEAIDRYTFTLYTGEPNAFLFDDLSSQGNSIFPASLIESGHDFNVDPVGSGPFIFEEWRTGEHFRFRAFHDYWLPERAARIEEVTWRVIPEGSTRTIAYEMGEIDFIHDVPTPDIPRFKEMPDTTVVMLASPVLNFANFNHQRPQFQNFYARKAINMAINQEEIVLGAYDGFGVAQRAQLPSVFPGASYEGVAPYDPAGARALLAEHGIDPASLAFEMIAVNEATRRAAEIMQAQLAEIGIPISIVMMDAPARTEAVLAGNFDTALASWNSAQIISVFRNLFAQIEGAPNRNQFYHPELNELIVSTVNIMDNAARDAVFLQASRIANEYNVMIPTHLTTTIRVFNSNLRMPELSGMTTILNLNMAYWAN